MGTNNVVIDRAKDELDLNFSPMYDTLDHKLNLTFSLALPIGDAPLPKVLIVHNMNENPKMKRVVH